MPTQAMKRKKKVARKRRNTDRRKSFILGSQHRCRRVQFPKILDILNRLREFQCRVTEDMENICSPQRPRNKVADNRRIFTTREGNEHRSKVKLFRSLLNILHSLSFDKVYPRSVCQNEAIGILFKHVVAVDCVNLP